MTNVLEHIGVGDLLTNRNRDAVQKDIKFSVEEPLDESIVQTKPVTGVVQLFGAEDSVATVTQAETTYITHCDRCLIDINDDLNVTLNQEYSFEPKEDELLIEPDFSVNIWTPLRQELLVSIPLKKLCTENCKGLCPECGKNLNREPHAHEKHDDEINPFAKLKDLKNNN